MAIVLKYSAAVYQAKISSFDSLDNELDAHLESLQSLRDRVGSFWQGEQTAQYMDAIAKAINKVRLASADIKKLSREYTEIINEQNRIGGAVDDVVGMVDKAVDRTIDVAGTAAKILPLAGL